MQAASKPAPSKAADPRRRLPTDLLDEISLRRRLRRAWQQSRSPTDKTAFNAQSNKVKALLRLHRDAAWSDFLATLAVEDGSLWQISKCLRREKKTIGPLRADHGMVYDPPGKAELFANTMEAQFSPHDTHDHQHTEIVTQFLQAFDPAEDDEEDPPAPVNEDEVAAALTALKPRKAPGPDSLGAPALRQLPRWTITWLTVLFNSCFLLRHFPSCWKSAKLILIPKPKKNLLLPDNYRPISLLPTLSKVLERLILSRIPQEFHNSIRPEQFGFRRGHSTTLQLMRVTTALADAANKKEVTTSILLDVTKAFDKVWHEGLLFKLAHSPLPRSLWQLLRSYLQDRTFAVTVGNATSSLRPVTAGVPQGSVLGPILYLWYTNDIPLAPRVTLSLYADDAMFSATSMKIRQSTAYMQRQMDLLAPWLRKWRIQSNPAKSEAICFTKSPFGIVQRHTLRLDGNDIPWKKSVKYLGVTLDRQLTLSHHVKQRLNIVQAAVWKLGPLTGKNSPLSTKTKLLFYRAIVRPAMMYAAPAWYHLLSTASKARLQTLQNKCLRRATNSPWFVRNTTIMASADITTVEQYAKEDLQRLLDRTTQSTWGHLRELVAADGPPQIRVRRPRALLDDPP